MAAIFSRSALAWSLPLTLAACTVGDPYPVPSLPRPLPDEGCNAGGFRHLVGMRIDESGLVDGGYVRIIRPDDMVTQDHRPDRVNIILDWNDWIIRVQCG